ncbi:hypothetical protein B0H11DRAFT_1371926 [Mycena galericulata]|nr:hypothetical protein B0H11DRAFT_1371926 [Mycena galericulata]
MSSAPNQAELAAELLQLIADTQTTNYLVVASLTLAVVEHVSTFRDEVRSSEARLQWISKASNQMRFIWKGPLRISNAIYIWMRYCALVTLVVYSTFMLREIKSDRAEAVTSSLIVVTADVVLVLRVWVLYGKPRIMLYFLLPLVTVEIITMITVGVLTILPLRDFFHIGPAILGCYSLSVPRYFTFYAVPLVATSFTMFLMTLYKCGHTLLANRGAPMPIIKLFLRDGVFWFLAIFAISFAELLVWARGRPGLAQATPRHSVEFCDRHTNPAQS